MPDQCTLELMENRTNYQPGEIIEGIAGWQLEKPVDKIEVLLCWKTSGRGTEDTGIADSFVFENPQPVDAQIFQIKAPNGPYSYDGKLIAIRWALEIVAGGKSRGLQLGVTISSTGQQVVLDS